MAVAATDDHLVSTTAPSDATQAIEQALLKADVPAMQALYLKPPDLVTRTLAAMALERMHYNFDQASKDARLCENALLDTQPDIALFCARFANGDLRLSGDEQAAAREELGMIERYRAVATPAALARIDTGRDPLFAALPPVRVRQPAGAVSVALEDQQGGGAVAVKLNGKPASLLVDTGSPTTTLDEATAKAFGIHLLDDKTDYTRGLLSKHIPTHLGLLDKLEIGDIVVEHLPVTIIPGRRRILGTDVLKRLGALRFTRDKMIVYGPDAPRPACAEPLRVASTLWGSGLQPVVHLTIDGARQATVLDTGNAFYLSGNSGATAHSRGADGRMWLGDFGKDGNEARYRHARALVEISGQPIKMTFAVFKDAKLPWDYLLGFGALRDMDFFVDFRDRHLCLLLHDDLR